LGVTHPIFTKRPPKIPAFHELYKTKNPEYLTKPSSLNPPLIQAKTIVKRNEK
jgi:hypothetical protein